MGLFQEKTLQTIGICRVGFQANGETVMQLAAQRR